MNIRRARKGRDEASLSSLWIKLARDMEPYSRFNALSDDAAKLSQKHFEEVLKEDSCAVFILSVEQRDVGYIFVKRAYNPTLEHCRSLHIMDIFVEKAFRDQGYGTKLLERAKAWGETHDCTRITADTEWDNEDAQRFFRAHGFGEKQVSFGKALSSA